MEECVKHLLVSDEAKAEGGGSPCGDVLGEFVEGEKGVGPEVAGPEDVPRAENGGGDAARLESLFAGATNADIGLHDGGRVGNRHVDEVAGAGG